MNDRPVAAAGFLLFRDTPDGRRWLLLQNAKHGDWGFPKGHAEAGEDALTTAHRECREETGIDDVTVVGDCESVSYPTKRGYKTVTYFPGRCPVETAVAISPEHSRYEWLDEAGVAAHLQHANLRSLFLLVAGRIPC